MEFNLSTNYLWSIYTSNLPKSWSINGTKVLAHTLIFDYRVKYTIEAQFQQARIAPGTVVGDVAATYCRSEPYQSDFWSEQLTYPNIFAPKVKINKNKFEANTSYIRWFQSRPLTLVTRWSTTQLKRKGGPEDNNIP